MPSIPPIGDALWARLDPVERALQVAAWHADKLRTREVGGNNRGPAVREFLRSVGLGEGYAWCAAFVTSCLKQADYPDLPDHPASVLGWESWARKRGALVSTPSRGDLFYWLNPKTWEGHIGFVVRSAGPLVMTIEGNTGPGEQGSQRDGDGVYRRLRIRSKCSFIRL